MSLRRRLTDFGLVALCIIACSSIIVAGDATPSSAPSSSNSQVVTLTDVDFDSQVQPNTGNNGDWFVEFYAPWCGHCKNLAPVWDKLSVAVSDASIVGRDIRIGQVDATLELAQAKRFDVRGYPSLKLFSQGKVYDYKGPRTLEALEKFAKSGGEGVEAKGIPEPPNQIELALEWFLGISGDVQTILLRHPLAGCIFFLFGLLLGILISVLIFATCIDNRPSEWVQYRDPATGRLVTVPYVRTAASPTPIDEANQNNTQTNKKNE